MAGVYDGRSIVIAAVAVAVVEDDRSIAVAAVVAAQGTEKVLDCHHP